jgi:hypothetical protein
MGPSWTGGAAGTGRSMVLMYRLGLSRQRTVALVRAKSAAAGYSCGECRQTKPERLAVLPIHGVSHSIVWDEWSWTP